MWPYVIIYLIPAASALLLNVRRHSSARYAWWLLIALLVLFVGYRHQVGGDWFNYFDQFVREMGVGIADPIEIGDPGYVYLMRMVSIIGGDVHEVNLVAAIIFVLGLMVFCWSQPYPWLALAVAIPYIVVVMGMGYTRQAIALGLIMGGVVYLEKGRLAYYVVFVALAVLFHKTAVIMMPLGIFLHKKGWMLRGVAVCLAGLGLWEAFLVKSQGELWRNYVDANMQSQGAWIRVIMNALPASILIIQWKRWRICYPNARLWLWVSAAAIACLPLVGYASTAVDRIALYLTPLQIVVYSRLPILWRRSFNPIYVMSAIILVYGGVLLVWLNYAVHAPYWVPYRNILFE